MPIIVPAASDSIRREVRLESTLGSVRQISSILLQSVGMDGGNYAGKISTTRYQSSSEAPDTVSNQKLILFCSKWVNMN